MTAGTAGAALTAVLLAAVPAGAEPTAPVPAAPDCAGVDAGAEVPFFEIEAECAAHRGTVIGPDLTQASLPSEASGRQAVRLSAAGDHVEFTLTEPANSLNLRYSVPDGRSGTLSVYVNGRRLDQRLAVTAKYSHVRTPFIPGSKIHHFYDESRMLLGRSLGAGDRVRVQVDAGDEAGPYTVDLADFEQVAAPLPAPGDALPVTGFGATPDDGRDDTAAFRAGIQEARSSGRPLWIPRGTFEIGSALQVDQVTIRGAGPWYSVLHGDNVFNNNHATGGIELRDFAIFGEVTERVDAQPANGFHGVLGTGSTLSNLWIQHTKCGLWLMNGATRDLTVEDSRFLDLQADGINFDGNVKNSTIRNNFFRNTGDDAIALWSNGVSDSGDSIVRNTVIQPNLANGIAVYGGESNSVVGNLVRDTNALGGGIHVGNRFNATPLTGTILVEGNTTVRAGALDPNWQFGVGALWFDGRDSAFSGVDIRVRDNRLIDSPYEAIQFIDGSGQGKPMGNVTVEGGSIEGAGTFAVQAQTGGTVSISDLSATGLGVTGLYNCPYPSDRQPLTIDGSGNSGWDGTWTDCSSWPDPGSGPPPEPGPDDNLALHGPVTASGNVGGYPPAAAVDGDADTYWESTNGAFPGTITVDLGRVTEVGRIVLALPPSTAWPARTQTLSVLGSTDGQRYATLAGPEGYRFDPATGNSVTIQPAASEQRYLRLRVTANSEWPAAQVAELEVYRE
ncbi:discoidin domain-containing protein [Amycolatopsis cihanbeyliensis]|uniref:discoidin domain-containing protein n=1 Tax=Amycolatopsis cihanbeyliensis TaxID=1128664 RepID=UPI001FE71A00|nr:discoidin domain-containing protein [Amycolatopsis cihanbeyliensis]